MPVLSNPRHERFAQGLASGKTATESLAAIGSDQSVEPKGYYVYVLIDPCDGSVFYVGKGKGRRRHQHLKDWRRAAGVNWKKMDRISRIIDAGHRPIAAWVEDNLSDRDAYRAERALMFRIGLESLTNSVGAPMHELDRAALEAKHSLRRVRPYCRMWRVVPRPEPGWEHGYWGVIAGLSEIALQKDSKIRPGLHFDAWIAKRRENDQEARRAA